MAAAPLELAPDAPEPGSAGAWPLVPLPVPWQGPGSIVASIAVVTMDQCYSLNLGPRPSSRFLLLAVFSEHQCGRESTETGKHSHGSSPRPNSSFKKTVVD